MEEGEGEGGGGGRGGIYPDLYLRLRCCTVSGLQSKDTLIPIP